MNEQQYFEAGQHAAIRGRYRVLCNAPSSEHSAAWYEGYDSVPRELRNTGPKIGPIPSWILERLEESLLPA